MSEKHYKNTAVYRAMKVLYGIGWVFVVLIMIATFYLTKPQGYVNMKESGFTCPDGKNYVWTSSTGYYTKEDKVLETNDHLSALSTCKLYDSLIGKFDTDAAIKAGYSQKEIDNYLSEQKTKKAEESRLKPPYKLFWVTDETGNKWFWAAIWTFIALIVANFLLDTIRNIVLYITYGEGFTYPMLKMMYSEKDKQT
jgi:hypothetical protein